MVDCREFLAELYVRGDDEGHSADVARRAREAAAELAAGGANVRFVRSIFVPSDEICLLVFRAESPSDVERVAELAAIAVDRVVEMRDLAPDAREGRTK